MEKIMEIIESNGTNNGYCKLCRNYFKKNDYIIIIEKGEINKIKYIKICAKCYITLLAKKMGWKKLNDIFLKMAEEKI